MRRAAGIVVIFVAVVLVACGLGLSRPDGPLVLGAAGVLGAVGLMLCVPRHKS